MDPSSSLYLLDKVWLFPALMAVSFLLILFVGKRLPEKGTSAIGIGAVTLCFLGSLLVGAQWINRVNHPPTGTEMTAAEQASAPTHRPRSRASRPHWPRSPPARAPTPRPRPRPPARVKATATR